MLYHVFTLPDLFRFAQRDRFDKELKRLQVERTLEPVEISEWAAPNVAVLKSDKNSVQICKDFSVTINLMSKLDRYLILKVDDLFSQLSGGKYFTKLDVSNACQQVPFGVSSAPGIFQRIIEGLLQEIEGVVVYLDDSLITGSMESMEEKHLKTLDEVLSHLDKAGRASKSKEASVRVCHLPGPSHPCRWSTSSSRPSQSYQGSPKADLCDYPQGLPGNVDVLQ